MTDNEATVGRQDERKFLSKHRWRGKIFSNDEAPAKETKQQKANIEQDVADFLKPSTQKAQLNVLPKPRIDVAAAQRWPGAHDIHAQTPSPRPTPLGIPSSMRGSSNSRPRKGKGLTVSFARTAPEVIGEGGDEAESPSIEVSRRKSSTPLVDLEQLQGHRDDSVVGLRSPEFNGLRSGQSKQSVTEDERPLGTRRRAQTSHGEISPPLQLKMDMGNITSQAALMPPPPQRLGPLGLGDRPQPLKRAPTGFQGVDDGVPRPSMDSINSADSDDFHASPISRRVNPAFTEPLPERDEFEPQPLRRTQTSFVSHDVRIPEEEDTPRLPEMNLGENDSPIDFKKHFLESEPSDPNSFSARVQQKMRADEGRALHEAASYHTSSAVEDGRRPSVSSANSFSVGSPQSYTQLPSGSAARSSYEAPFPPPVQLQPRPSNSPRRSPVNPTMTQPQLQSRPPNAPRSSNELPIRKPFMAPQNSHIDIDTKRPSASSSPNYPIPQPQTVPRGSPIAPAPSPRKAQFDNYPNNGSLHPSPQPPSRNSPGYFTSSTSEMEFAQPLRSPALAPDQDPGMHAALPSNQDPVMQAVAPSRQDPGMQAAPHSLSRSDTRSQGDAALADFTDRVIHMQGIFRLTAELERPLHEFSPMQWLRAAIWWFLRGRAGMENLIRNRPRGDPGAPPTAQLLTQAHVDLAKTWWILTEVIQNHPAIRKYGDLKAGSQARSAREAGDIAMAEIFEVHNTVLGFLKLLLASMKRHHVMPPRQSLIQGQDQTIWIKYPSFAPDVKAILSGNSTKSLVMDGPAQQLNPLTCMPPGDTKTDFCYFRMFVQVSVTTDEAETDRVPIPCVLSVLRSHNDLKVKISICSLNELVNIRVQNDKKLGPTWDDVTWKVRSSSMCVSLPHGFNLNIDFTEQDLRNLWTVVDHTNKIEMNLRPREDERIVYSLTLREFQYKDPANSGVFPAERVKRCRVVLFEKCKRSNEGSGKRRLHRGYRFLIVTNPKSRTLNSISHEFGKQEPMNFEFKADASESGFPVVVLRVKEKVDKKLKQCIMFLIFNDEKERDMLFGTLTGMNVDTDETVFAQVPLKGFSIENADQVEGFSHSGRDALKRLQWQDVKTLNLDPETGNMDTPQTVLSERLRVVARHSAGSLTDRMNLSPGELLLRLQTSGSAEITILRNPQEDMNIAVDAKRTEQDIPEALAELLRTLTTASTLRTYSFHSLKDLHAFQMAITGFYVKFDGIASSYTIARRRMVVPIYKRWEASTVRIQIVQQDNICRLLAFFEEFSHADSMAFQLKSMDVFEKADKGGKFYLRLVDAKFALPVEERKGEGKLEKAEGRQQGWAGQKRRFVCLDVVEYPGEHDDVTIGFDIQAERDRFADALPAATQISRMKTFSRKV